MAMSSIPHDSAEGKDLELRLGAGTHHGHPFRVLAGQVFGNHRRDSGRAQRREQSHLCFKGGVSIVDVGKHAEGRKRLESARGIGGVTVDLLKGILLTVGGGHDFDDAKRCVCEATRAILSKRSHSR